MYDAIVIGARCAGSPTAMLLARKGYRVLLVDKASFPSDTMSTHYIHQTGIARLKRWGVLEQIIASNCPPIYGYVFGLGPLTLTGSPPAVDGIAEAYAPRRKVLDGVLVDAAIDAGAELREKFVVQELLMDGERVVGIRGQTWSGTTVTEAGHIIIGADGRNSFVARTVRAPAYNTHPSYTCSYYAYWSGVGIEALEYYPREGLSIIALPTSDGLSCILVARPHREFHAFRTDIEGNFWTQLNRVPEFAARVRAGRREERFVGTADLPHFFRKPYGPGWVLVGDAGYHKDPQGGEGITDALRDAEHVAEAIDAGLNGRRRLDEALADYEQHRNAVAMPVCELVTLMARLEPFPPEMVQLLTALQGNPSETSRFFGTISQAVPAGEFLTPDHMQQIIGRTGSPGVSENRASLKGETGSRGGEQL